MPLLLVVRPGAPSSFLAFVFVFLSANRRLVTISFVAQSTSGSAG